jgi:transcriptional regulator with XRE-family HTH domain
MGGSEERRLLGEFVRASRERMEPGETGGRKRRTPGLRREELAARAGISAIWCAWIEQGREIQVSPKTLSRLADALNLSAAERAKLFKLAGREDPAPPTRDWLTPPGKACGMTSAAAGRA